MERHKPDCPVLLVGDKPVTLLCGKCGAPAGSECTGPAHTREDFVPLPGISFSYAHWGNDIEITGSQVLSAQETIEQREGSHGNYLHQARLAQDLKRRFRDESEGWKACSVEQRESLDMLAVKISRILVGNPNVADHWTDLAGYATLISNLLTKGTHL